MSTTATPPTPVAPRSKVAKGQSGWRAAQADDQGAAVAREQHGLWLDADGDVADDGACFQVDDLEPRPRPGRHLRQSLVSIGKHLGRLQVRTEAELDHSRLGVDAGDLVTDLVGDVDRLVSQRRTVGGRRWVRARGVRAGLTGVGIDRRDGVRPDETDDDRVAVLARLGMVRSGPNGIFEAAKCARRHDRDRVLVLVRDVCLVDAVGEGNLVRAGSCRLCGNGTPVLASKIVTSPRSRFTTQTLIQPDQNSSYVLQPIWVQVDPFGLSSVHTCTSKICIGVDGERSTGSGGAGCR